MLGKGVAPNAAFVGNEDIWFTCGQLVDTADDKEVRELFSWYALKLGGRGMEEVCHDDLIYW